MKQQRWDIFCTVVDNFGDIGICWRLARQLVHEHRLAVRLWVDDLTSFAHIAPDLDPTVEQQRLRGVEVCHWRQSFAGIEPADVVIEALACDLPDDYISTMAALPQPPLWLNLEYLSAEDWVTGCHRLPSPHPRLPLVKHFFFPGFVPGTGGLLLEQQLLSARNAFDDNAQLAFWQRLGVPVRKAGEVRISLFCYGSAPLGDMLATWAASTVPVCVLLPQEPIVDIVAAFFGVASLRIGEALQSGRLTLRLIPFLEQTEYDQLLWACDFNFVRGEDSFVRAQWAAKPFVWHIYPQVDNAHRVKLDAFLALYTASMPPDMAAAVHALWCDWNGVGQVSNTWPAFAAHHAALIRHGENWAGQLRCLGDLAANLVQFSRNRI